MKLNHCFTIYFIPTEGNSLLRVYLKQHIIYVLKILFAEKTVLISDNAEDM